MIEVVFYFHLEALEMTNIFTCKKSGLHRVMLASLGVLLLLPGVSNAEHYLGQCSTELNALELAINGAVFLGKRAGTDQSNLLVKLEAAAAKIALLKYSDAIDKLVDISDTATKLANAPKPKLEDATAINLAVESAISCSLPPP